MREAFGVQQVRYSGIVEQDGSPTRPAAKNVARIKPEDASNTPGPAEPEQQLEGLKAKQDRSFALAAASLRQAMQEMPEISELSKHIMIEETDTGLNIEIVDQEGRSMFPDGAREPYERTRRIVQKLAGPLKALPNRVSVTGHTAASRMPPRPGYGAWELSADRANAVRQILEDQGLPSSHLFMVAGKADSQPLFPDDPHIAANRRVTITLMREAPPLPPGFKP
jgi:chemotaxis protein MotB